MFQLNNQQLDAVKSCVKWYFTQCFDKIYFAIGGIAGSGKSTVVSIIIKMLGLSNNDVIFCTLTGKASLVLRMKGNPSNTIHKTFYSVFKKGNSFLFSLKKRIPSTIKLIVVDEVSMVTAKMLEDILSFRVPTICLGDSGQLPAVGATNFIMENPQKYWDVFLTIAMRQDDTTGVLDLACLARNNQLPEYGKYKNSLVCHLSDVEENLHKYDMVVCYSNAMRRKLNMVIRYKLGFSDSVYPKKGEKIVCLMNNYNYGMEYEDIPIYIVNGMIGICNKDTELEQYGDMEVCNLNFTPDFLVDKNTAGNLNFDTKCFAEIFEQYTKDVEKQAFIEELCDNSIDDEKLGNVCMIDFGYAATVHKMQGSEANNVLVIVEQNIPSNIYFRWLYTGITRAKQSVTVATVS